MMSKPFSQKRFWNYIKCLRKDNAGVSPLTEDGKLHPEPKAKANILNQPYQSVFTHEDESNIPTPDGDPYPSMPNITISEERIFKLLKKTNPHKAAGPDGIPARILKECARNLAAILTTLFN